MTPVHSVTSDVSEDVAETFKKLDMAREAGTLAGNRELAAEGYSPSDIPVPTFNEKSEDELAKMTKSDLIAYMQEWAAAQETLTAQKIAHAEHMTKVAAIHGIPRGKVGEAIEAMLESNPEHPGRGVPYALVDAEGEPRVTKKARNRKGKITPAGTPVTRMDN